MVRSLLLFCVLFITVNAKAQTVKNTSYLAQSGEKVLRLELIVPIEKKVAWEYFTKDEKLEKWIAPLAHIELKIGGYILTNYNKDGTLKDSSTIKLDIVNFIDNEMITFKVNLNDNFTKEVQNTDNNLQEIIQFIDLRKGKTKIISSMVGWGSSNDWDKAYNFFVKGNVWTYQELGKLFEQKK